MFSLYIYFNEKSTIFKKIGYEMLKQIKDSTLHNTQILQKG